MCYWHDLLEIQRNILIGDIWADNFDEVTQIYHRGDLSYVVLGLCIHSLHVIICKTDMA